MTDLNAAEKALSVGANVIAAEPVPVHDRRHRRRRSMQQQAARLPGKLVNFLRGQRGTEGLQSPTR